MSEGNGGGPEQLGGGTQPTGVSVETPGASTKTPSFENPASLATKPPILSETELAAEPGQAQPEGETQALHPEQSSRQSINMIEILTQEFGLDEKQQELLKQKIPELKEKGIDLQSFSEEDLGDPKKMGIILEIIGSEEMGLSDEQRENLEKIQETLQSANQEGQLTERDMRAEITERKNQIISRIQQLQQKQQSGQVLTQEEQEELNQNQQALAALTEMESRVGEISQNQSAESKTQIKQSLLEKAPTYIKYAGFGLAALFFIFVWQGLRNASGGQGRGMMG
jgi:hypothetical protein